MASTGSDKGPSYTPVSDTDDESLERGAAGTIQDQPPHHFDQESPHPSWSYATKKTIAKGMLNAALLISNATALKGMFDVAESKRNAFWITNVSLIITSILLQVVASIMMFVLSIITPKDNRQLRSVTILNNAVVGLVLFISTINMLTAGFGLQISESE